MRRRGQTLCDRCDKREKLYERIEHAWLSRFRSWAFYPSVHDKAIHQCNAQGKKVFRDRARPDFLFLLPDRPYDVLVECDEREHVGNSPLCEMGRLYDIQESIRAAQGVTRRNLLVVRFNADAENQEDLMHELWRTLTQVITRGVTWGDDMEMPVWLYALVGYTDRRVRKYKYQGIEFQKQPEWVEDDNAPKPPAFRKIEYEFWDQPDRETGGLQKVAKV